MNIEETDQLTVNIEPGLNDKRPVKKKAAPGKSAKVTGGAKPSAATKAGKSSAPKKAGSTSKPAKKVPGQRNRKPGKSPSGVKSRTGAKAPGLRTNKLGKSSKKAVATKKSSPAKAPTTNRAKKPGKSSTAAPKSSNGSKKGKRGAITTGKTSIDPSTLKPDRLYGITRVNQPHKGNLGWWLRIGPKGSRHDQFFADKKNGGEAKALKLATARRNELYDKLPLKLKHRGAIKRKVAA